METNGGDFQMASNNVNNKELSIRRNVGNHALVYDMLKRAKDSGRKSISFDAIMLETGLKKQTLIKCLKSMAKSRMARKVKVCETSFWACEEIPDEPTI